MVNKSQEHPTMKGDLVPYITRGHGAGEVMIDLGKLGVPPKEWKRLAAQCRQKRQIKRLEITGEGWLQAKIDLGNLQGDKLEAAVKKIHNEIEQRAMGFKPQHADTSRS